MEAAEAGVGSIPVPQEVSRNPARLDVGALQNICIFMRCLMSRGKICLHMRTLVNEAICIFMSTLDS